VAGELRFGDISVCIETTLARVGRYQLNLDAVRDADRAAREAARSFVEQRVAEPLRRP
jgi:1-deoxy-D-xylulose 5-phosphate reductoisomerase